MLVTDQGYPSPIEIQGRKETVRRKFWPRPSAKINDYDPIADVFDEVMALDFHAATHHIRRNIILSLGKRSPLRCLDLCAGTGVFFSLLAQEFTLEAFGIDLSKNQISVARKRAEAKEMLVDYQVGDIVEADYPSEIDLVSINFDALNHIGSSNEWLTIFQKANRSLATKGVLVFDINLPERLLHDWNYPEVIAKANLCYIQLSQQARPHEGGVIRCTPMIIFESTASGRFIRRDAMVEQFALPIADVVRLLKSSGFASVDVVANFGAVPEGHQFNKNRAYLCARK